MDALTEAREVRLKELAVDRWQVLQHPLNQHPPGHSHHVPSYPCPYDLRELFRERDALSERFKERWGGLTPATPDVELGTTGIWCPTSFLYLPCRVADTRHGLSGGFVERLDDPELEPGGPYTRKAWYRVTDWREFRVGRSARTSSP